MAFLEKQDYQAEVSVVENASRDNTAGVAVEVMDRCPLLPLIRDERQCNGLAVQAVRKDAAGGHLCLCHP